MLLSTVKNKQLNIKIAKPAFS